MGSAERLSSTPAISNPSTFWKSSSLPMRQSI